MFTRQALAIAITHKSATVISCAILSFSRFHFGSLCHFSPESTRDLPGRAAAVALVISIS
jgi:hypothetical protein